MPNVGKSTLFNAVTRTRKAQAANYPFCTIDPNQGIVAVPDLRLETLAKMSGYIAERQIERLRVVGSNDVTTPVIEASYRRLLGLLDSHLVSGRRFLMGAVPARATSAFSGS